jgi:hypothetical protein
VALGGFPPAGASASVGAVVRPTVPASTMPASTSSAGAAGEETGKERMELRDSLLWDIDCDRLVLRGGFGWI